MKLAWSSYAMIVVLSATQVMGPATLWAAERNIRNDENRRVVVAAVDGTQLTVQNEDRRRPLQFRDVVHVEEQITTGDHTVADLLIGTQAVVSMGHDTALQLLPVNPKQTTIQVTQGMVRVATAASALGPQGVVTIKTPTGQVQTRGGIVRVLVEAPVGKAEPVAKNDVKAYRASYVSEPLLAATSPQKELIQVEEGAAEILEASGKNMTVQSGQSVTIQAGKTGMVGESVKQAGMRPGVMATPDHSQTPKEGRDHLVALQIDQATKLTDQLINPKRLSPNKTKSGDGDKKSDTKDVINGATGGVPLDNNSGGGNTGGRAIVDILFGSGNAANPSASNPTNVTGAGYGYNNSECCPLRQGSPIDVKVNGDNPLLVFTRADQLREDATTEPPKISIGEQVKSSFMVAKELVLIGSSTNRGHGGKEPSEPILVRGITDKNVAIDPLDNVVIDGGIPAGNETRNANSTFLVKDQSREEVIEREDGFATVFYKGGTLGQFSSDPNARSSKDSLTFQQEKQGLSPVISFVDGAITATTAGDRPTIRLTGGVALDQATIATIGTTAATDTYFKDLNTDLGRTFTGSLLSVIKGPNSTPTVLTMQDCLLGVYDGSEVKTEGGNKALLSVLDAKLKMPGSSIPLIDIAAGTHFDRDGKATQEKNVPNVEVTTALVTRSTIQLDKNPLDNKLLEASAPLFALTQATMTTTNHFADLAGSHAQSLKLGDALVALDASKLSINNGHLLNLNNATAAIGGYLFSLTNGSQLDIKNGALFSLNNGSLLALNGNALGVFGIGANTLSIDNNLCGAGATCGALVNSANQPLALNGVPLKVAGVAQDVVLPNGFDVFAGNAATTTVKIDANDALFQVDGTSTLTINGTRVK